MHLLFTDQELVQYDTNYKLMPPLRSEVDRQALINGVMDGTIDCIASHHMPWDVDHKIVEFQAAAFGVTGLETAFGAVRKAIGPGHLDRLVDLFALAPRRVFGLPAASVQKGNKADFTLFLPEAEWTPSSIRSRSANSPFINKSLTGKPFGIIHKEQLLLNA
jgi:dihydroorotase